MRADKLIVGLGENEVAHLRTGINAVQRRQVDCVPEANALIGGAASGGEEATVERAPINSLDSGVVIRELFKWLVTIARPDDQLVIVTS